jgi:hypothetical protein
VREASYGHVRRTSLKPGGCITPGTIDVLSHNEAMADKKSSRLIFPMRSNARCPAIMYVSRS